MSFLYITADEIGTPTGGGAVTYHESQALAGLGETICLGRQRLPDDHSVWANDLMALYHVGSLCEKGRGVRNVFGHWIKGDYQPKLAHFYSGTFSRTVAALKASGCKVVYTIAAHRVADSRQAFESLGLPYNFPHLTDPEQWRRYSAGYFAADAIVCPSTHSRDVVQEQARELGVPCPPITVIPHGCALPVKVEPVPATGPFRVGYCGAYGPDKGVRYLLEAWKRLNYKDAVLVLAGQDSIGAFARHLVSSYGGGNIQLAGWQHSMESFFENIHLYVQPSATEGFGLEVLESLASSRPVVCSDHAGAKDLVSPECGRIFPAGDVSSLADSINWYKSNTACLIVHGNAGRKISEGFSWAKIRERYKSLWMSILKL